MMYAAQIAELIEWIHLLGTYLFRLGGLLNPKSEISLYILQNILLKSNGDEEPKMMNHLTDLNLMDS